MSKIIEKACPKVNTKWSPEENKEIDPVQIEETVECLKGQNIEILKIYQQNVEDYHKSLQGVNAKRVQEFRNIKMPNYSEYNIGIAMLYILACVDGSIMLSSNKKEVFDISWEAVVRVLSNSGTV